VSDRGRQVRVTDARTGQPLLTQIETEEARRQEQKARLVAEAHVATLEQRLRELESQLKYRT
jgi:hypothetical protein